MDSINNQEQNDCYRFVVGRGREQNDCYRFVVGRGREQNDCYRFVVGRGREQNDCYRFVVGRGREQNDCYRFVVGRGREQIGGFLNLPENKAFSQNCIYVDPISELEPDIECHIQDVDFYLFNDKKIELVFDYSTFYCSAMLNLPLIAKKIGRLFTILVPLHTDEKNIPSDALNFCRKHNYEIKMVAGEYPLFDFDKQFLHGQRQIVASKIINKEHYMVIIVDANSDH